nr:EOG090X0DX5 [Triops cancriformis]
MSSQKSTKEVLLSLIQDVEIISRELLENLSCQKHQKLPSVEHFQLVDMLLQKHSSLKETLETAAQQALVHQKMVALQNEVDRQDQEIRNLQKQLKEAEQILATAVYQAKQKLLSIHRANKRPVSSEDLIRFAHRISASNAVCAPLTWQQGDLRRPYPTDLEMRLGFISRVGELPSGGLSAGGISDMLHRAGNHPEMANSQAGTYSWYTAGEMHLPLSSQAAAAAAGFPIDSKHKKEAEDVDVMSSDSSSSSSSDSQ